MKKFFLLFLLASLTLIISSCGDSSDGKTSLTTTTEEETGENCEKGGTKLTTGIDLNDNKLLDENEITSTSYICNGENGETGTAGENCSVKKNDDGTKTVTCGEDSITINEGTNGENGENGKSSMLSITEEEAGENCVSGGKKIESGIDDDENGILEESEVDETEYICNGANGEDGETGTNGICADNNEPVIDSVTINEMTYENSAVEVDSDVEFSIIVSASDSNNDQITFNLIAGNMKVTNVGDGTYNVTIDENGYYYPTITASDGCQIVTKTIEIHAFPILKAISPTDTDTHSATEGLSIDQSNGNLYLLQQGETMWKTTVKQYQPITSSWTQIGDALSGMLNYSSIIADGEELYFNSNMSFYQYDFTNSSWVEKASIELPGSSDTIIKKAPDGTIYAAGIGLTNGDSGYQKVTVRKYDKINNTWETVGGEAFTVTSSAYEEFDFTVDDTTGELYVAVISGETTSTESIEVYKYSSTNSAWETLPKPTGDTLAYYGSQTILKAYNGTLYIAYYFSGDITIKQYNGTSWETVGTPPRGTSGFALKIYRQELYLFYQNDEFGKIMKYNGSDWTSMFSDYDIGINARTFAIEIYENQYYISLYDNVSPNPTTVLYGETE